MYDSIALFITSQVLVFIALIFDIISFQYKEKKYTLICFMISVTLLSVHYFFLDKLTAGLIMCLSLIRFIVSYFRTGKRYMVIFIILNGLVVIFTYKNPSDLILYAGIIFFIIGTFQKRKRNLQIFMMIGTLFSITYNAIILSPIAVLTEVVFLGSNMIGYYRFYVKKEEEIQKEEEEKKKVEEIKNEEGNKKEEYKKEEESKKAEDNIKAEEIKKEEDKEVNNKEEVKKETIDSSNKAS